MSPRRRRLLAAAVAALVIGGAVVAFQPKEPEVVHLRLVLGLKDQQPRDWSGKVSVAGGEVVALAGWRFEGKEDGIDGTKGWNCMTHNGIAPEKRYPVQDFAGKPKGKAEEVPWPNGVVVSVKGKSPTLTVTFADKRAITIDVAKVKLGEPLAQLEGDVRIERLPEASVVRAAAPPKVDTPRQDDYPAFWVHYKSNTHYLAWVEYQNAKTRVLLAQRSGPHGAWSEPLEVAGPGDHFRVALASTHGGKLWIVWASQKDGAWNLHGRMLEDGKLGPVEALTEGPGPNLYHRMTTDHKGRAWLVWQGFKDGKSQVFARCNADAKEWGEVLSVDPNPGNQWCPTITADPKADRVWVGWDEHFQNNYRVRVQPIPGMRDAVPPAQTPEASPLFQANVSLACDKDGRLWAAWDESGPQWGKDTGFLYGGQDRKDTTRLYASRQIRVNVLDQGKWVEPKQELSAVLKGELAEYNHSPQLQADDDGRMWLAFRHRTCRRPREDGWAAQGRWDVFATAYVGDHWLTPVELPLSAGRLHMQIDSQKDKQGAVYFAHASDNRPYNLPAFPPKNHHVAVSRFTGAPAADKFEFVQRKREFPVVAAAHPKEREQVEALRRYEVQAGGKTLKIYRGDLHRHTDISADGPGDGSILDLHRYALDAAMLDFVLIADHNMGQDNEYCWWRTQQANDLYTVGGKFISVYGYERSVKYPGGHRNILWAERGHRTLPLPVKPLPATLRADTGKLYEYLRKTKGICTLHTSASDQGTDWEAPHDPELEPIVELFQGYHTSYEALGAPKAIDAKSDMIHGPYKGDGFVDLALKKGYRLGFQSSSDHISTHVSYCFVLAEEFTRQGLIDAMKKRHTYATTDNILLDVRAGDFLMGDEFKAKELRLDVKVQATAPLAKVEVLRSGAVVYELVPNKKPLEAKFVWTDKVPLRDAGDANYYYVRVSQTDGQMAWSSPMWVTGEK
jgi:hypothetical protein